MMTAADIDVTGIFREHISVYDSAEEAQISRHLPIHGAQFLTGQFSEIIKALAPCCLSKHIASSKCLLFWHPERR